MQTFCTPKNSLTRISKDSKLSITLLHSFKNCMLVKHVHLLVL
eukprot:UN02869